MKGEMNVSWKDIITLVVCIIIFSYGMYGKFKHDNPPLPECVDLYDYSVPCRR